MQVFKYLHSFKFAKSMPLHAMPHGVHVRHLLDSPGLHIHTFARQCLWKSQSACHGSDACMTFRCGFGACAHMHADSRIECCLRKFDLPKHGDAAQKEDIINRSSCNATTAPSCATGPLLRSPRCPCHTRRTSRLCGMKPCAYQYAFL